MTNEAQQIDHSQWKLVLFDETKDIQVFPITKDTLTIGRELYNDIPLDNLHISKHHARLTGRENQLILEDLDSVNGTLVNDQPITEPHILQPDDVITLGPFQFRVEGPVKQLSQADIQTRAYPVHPIRPRRERGILLAGGLLALLLIIIFGITAGYYWLTPGSNQIVTPTPEETAAAFNVPAIVIDQAPANNSQVPAEQTITIQATASDPTGVTRVELWVNGRQVDEVTSQLSSDVPSMTAAFQWPAELPGLYALEIRAYNRSGLVKALPVATITVVGPLSRPTPEATDTPTITPLPLPPTPTTTPSPTFTPLPPTPTPQPALLTINIASLNVRTGPGTQYSLIGQLEQGDQVEILAQVNIGSGQWWQIRFNAGPDNLGWVSANPNFSTPFNVDQVPIATPPVLPPTPTSTASPTSSPTPTVTPKPPAIQAPEGKTLLIVSNRSLTNQPARLTLSGGKSVGGGREIDVAPNQEVQLVLEPDYYRALWSSPARSGGFVRGADFTAVPGKVIVMWIIPEDGLTSTEVYDQLKGDGTTR